MAAPDAPRRNRRSRVCRSQRMPDQTRRKNTAAPRYWRGCAAVESSASTPMTPTRRHSSRIFSMCGSGPSHYRAIERDRGGTGSTAWQKQGKICIKVPSPRMGAAENHNLTGVTRILYTVRPNPDMRPIDLTRLRGANVFAAPSGGSGAKWVGYAGRLLFCCYR